MSEDKFTQAEWTAQTVNQTVNNFPQLKEMSVDEKLDMVIRKMMGDPWYNEPGIMPTLKELAIHSDLARQEQLLIIKRLDVTDHRICDVQADQDSMRQWQWLTNIGLGIELIAIIFLLIQVFVT